MIITITTRAEAMRNAARYTRELDFTPPLPPEGKTKRERFEDFDRKNPQVFENIVTLAFQRIKDDERLGMKDLFEEMRRKYRRHTISEECPGGKRYNLNNNYTCPYSLKLTAEYPCFIGLIEQRKQHVAT